jgi:aspartyl-tRNA(Asn)/glutamyl-tRNA(Gln) amidotransferase subunit B
MEKGHLRCDANISVSDENGRMSEIVEIKNLNSFRFIEKALTIEEEKLKDSYAEWPEKLTKSTHGYDSVKNITYIQRRKEEAADYRYFPEPDLPPFDTSEFDLEKLRSEIGEEEDVRVEKLVSLGLDESDAKVLTRDVTKEKIFQEISKFSDNKALVAKVIVHNYFGESIGTENAEAFAKIVDELKVEKISKGELPKIGEEIKNGKSVEEILAEKKSGQIGETEIEKIIEEILAKNPKEVEGYRNGKKQLIGFFVGQAMKISKGKADPRTIREILQQKLS